MRPRKLGVPIRIRVGSRDYARACPHLSEGSPERPGFSRAGNLRILASPKVLQLSLVDSEERECSSCPSHAPPSVRRRSSDASLEPTRLRKSIFERELGKRLLENSLKMASGQPERLVVHKRVVGARFDAVTPP